MTDLHRRRAVRRLGQVLLCVAAIGGGALLSWVTRPSPSAASVGQFPRPMPEAIPALARAEAEPPPAPLDPMPDPEAEPVDAPTATFAESLKEGLIITGATPHRMILFTFDDGPDSRNTPELLDTLDELGIRALFFLTTHRLTGDSPWPRRNREIARDIVRRGHLIGNHTHEHHQLPLLETEEVLAQVHRADEVLEDVLGSRAWLIRPPGGSRSPRVDRLLAERGYTQVLWNIGTGDFQVRDADSVVDIFTRVLARRERENGERGGVVLLHDTHAWSVEALPRIVAHLRQENCRLLDAEQELYDIVGDPRWFFTPRGDADASAPAPPATLDERTLARRQARLREETRQRCERVASR